MSDGTGSDRKIEDVIIIGSGPAGYTAALYTSRADLQPLVFEGFAWGGLLQQTTDVENYPGYPDGVMGPEMMQKFRDQAERFGTRFVTDDVTRVELSEDGGVHKVYVGDEEHLARSVILAMGAEPKKLGVPGEDELASRGVSYCATCDAAFFRDKPTIVVGGGDTAMEDATFLAKFAKDVKVVHRRDEFRASKVMLNRAEATDNIELLTPYAIDRFEGGGDNGALKKVFLENTEGGEDRELEIDGAFIAIGHKPNSDIVIGQVDTDDDGYVAGRGPLHPHQAGGRVRRRRPGGPHLPPGRDRGRLGLCRRAGRRGLPARPPDRRRGPLGGRPGQDGGRRREGQPADRGLDELGAPAALRPGADRAARRPRRSWPAAVPRAAAEGLRGARGGLGPLVHRHRVHRRGAASTRRHGPGAGRRPRQRPGHACRPASRCTSWARALAELRPGDGEPGRHRRPDAGRAPSRPPRTAPASAYRNISSQVEAVRLVTASRRRCWSIGAGEPDLLGAARVGLGALGAISAVTLRCVPHLHARAPRRADAARARCWTTSTATPTAPTTSSCTCSRTPTWR